jgi:hypothetical protein
MYEHGIQLIYLHISSLQYGRVQIHRRVVQEETVGCPPLPPSRSVCSTVSSGIKPWLILHLQVLGIPSIERYPPRVSSLSPRQGSPSRLQSQAGLRRLSCPCQTR